MSWEDVLGSAAVTRPIVQRNAQRVVLLSPWQFEFVEAQAKEAGLKKSEYVQRLIEQWMDNEFPPIGELSGVGDEEPKKLMVRLTTEELAAIQTWSSQAAVLFKKADRSLSSIIRALIDRAAYQRPAEYTH